MDKEGFQKLREDAKAIFGDEPFTVDTGHYLDHLLAELVELRKDNTMMTKAGTELQSILHDIYYECDEKMQKGKG